jgi:CelD/BcsL family acetyltransferase involved in cellulose biosynthesis
MAIYTFDPLADVRWAAFVERHPAASVFHTTEWLLSLKRTYSYTPVAFTTSAPTDALQNALVLCAVRSWLTGRRLVSLPFSDHCDALVDDAEELQALWSAVERFRTSERWKYVELRLPRAELVPAEPFRTADSYYLHRLDLRPSVEQLWQGLHRDSIQRRVRKAERERLEYEEGRSEALADKLFYLLELTRARHGVPIQPRGWFRNLVDCLGPAVSIRVVSKARTPVAAILTLTHGKRVVYKYGGSDARYNALGGTPLLFWRLIEDAKRAGAEELDLGRTDRDNAGLAVFKDRWGAQRSTLTYWRSPGDATPPQSSWTLAMARRAFYRLPIRLRRVTASLVYRHLA